VGGGRRGKTRHLPPSSGLLGKNKNLENVERYQIFVRKIKSSLKYSVIYVPVHKHTILERSVKIF
jgi:hypothetical protein